MAPDDVGRPPLPSGYAGNSHLVRGVVMAGSFLFTRDSAGRLGGEANVQPLLRSVHNNSTPTLDAAVATAAQNKLVRVDGATVYMEPDVALMMIGRKSELREQLA